MSLVGLASVAIGWRSAPAWAIEHDTGQPPATAVVAEQTPVVVAAAPGPAPEPTDGRPVSSGYQLNTPDHAFVLAEALGEISDLALAADGESLWAVHDEKGTLFRIALKDGSVVQTIDFHKKGDFEGVAVVGNQVVVGRSDGMLFLVDAKTGETTHFTVPLPVACNLEGLAWDSRASRLLLACKGPQGDRSTRAWAVYGLNLSSKELQKEPVFRITRQQIEDYLAHHPEQRELTRAMSNEFDPSGIAVHPQSGRVYLVSTRGRLLAVLDRSGALLRIEALARTAHPQPEGIAFSADGTLFISNEARGLRALLNRFKPLGP